MIFERLGIDCIVLLCKYLPTNDILNLAIASDLISELIKHDIVKLKGNIYLIDEGRQEQYQLITKMHRLQLCDKFKRVIFLTQEHTWYSIWNYFSYECPNVTHMSIYFGSFYNMSFRMFMYLQQLKLYHVALEHRHNVQIGKLVTLKQLFVIDVTGFETFCLGNLCELNTLSIFVMFADMDELARCISRMNKLTALDIRGCRQNSKVLAAVLNLDLREFGFTFQLDLYEKYLQISQLERLTNLAVELIPDNMDNPAAIEKVLDIMTRARNVKITSIFNHAFLSAISRRLTNVEYLNLCHHSNLRWCYIPEIPTSTPINLGNLKNLKTLVMNKLFYGQSFDLGQFVQRLPPTVNKLIITPHKHCPVAVSSIRARDEKLNIYINAR